MFTFAFTLTLAITVTVGAGGAGSTTNSTNGSNGNNSVFGTITSDGGGGGAGAFGAAGSNGLWNDNAVADLYAKWPITASATIALCTKKAAAMLQRTRAVTNFVSGPGREFTTGIAPLGDFPTSRPTFNGIPLVVTDSIVPGNQVVLN
jgi:hypothetical protein